MKKLNKNSQIKENTLNTYSLLSTNCVCSVCKCSCDCNTAKPSAGQQSEGKTKGSALGMADKK